MQTRLVVVGGDATPSEVDLELPISIGRGWDNGLCLPHPLVSRHHCRLTEQDGAVVVEDLGSLNGTYVGKLRVDGPTPLRPGELLTVGTVTFRAVYVAAGGLEGASTADGSGCDSAVEADDGLPGWRPVADDPTRPLPKGRSASRPGGPGRPGQPDPARPSARSAGPVLPSKDGVGDAATLMRVRGPGEPEPS